MNTLERRSPVFLWLMAWLLAVLVSACGGGGGEGGVSGPLIFSTNSAPGAPGTQLPGNTPADSTSPSVASSNPSQGATNVTISTVESTNALLPRSISATFSEPMNPASLVSPATTFTLKETLSGLGIAGTVIMNATHTVATFMPTGPLPINTQLTAIITTAATTATGTALASGYGWSFTTGSQVGQAPIHLKTAASFLVLSGTSIANTSTTANPTRVNGQLGIDPGTASNVTGFTDSTPAGTGLILTGGIQSGPVLLQAKLDLSAALAEANARTGLQTAMGSTELALFTVNGGSPGIYPPGLYTSATTFTLSAGNMTLDAQGDPDAVWIFKAASSLTVTDTRQVLLLNGARASHVFWVLGSSAQLGDQVSFKGNILAHTSSAIGTTSAQGSTLEGRIFSISDLQLNYASINTPAP